MLDEGTTEWLFDASAWVLEQFGTAHFYEVTPLVLPTPECFPVSTQGNPHDVVITYNPASVARPLSLVATFAHELAHFPGFGATEPPPGGEEFEEPATDLLAVYLGFGVFLANSAFNFEQHSDFETHGWSWQRQGHLSEGEMVYALAIFCELKDIDSALVLPHLDRDLRKTFKLASAELRVERAEEMAKLAGIDSGQGATSAAASDIGD